MTDLPQWAMEKAERVESDIKTYSHDGWETPLADHIARALVEAEARGIERAAKAGFDAMFAVVCELDGRAQTSTDPMQDMINKTTVAMDVYEKNIIKINDNPNE